VPEDEEIGILDAPKFWITSIGENFAAEPEYIVRGWFGWDW